MRTSRPKLKNIYLNKGFCLAGFSGSRCEYAIDSCLSHPCLNGARCQTLSPLGFNCICPSGYTGTLCQTVVNACASNPCAANGICNSAPNGGFYCSCRSGYTGSCCETLINVCSPDPCNAKGQCIQTAANLYQWYVLLTIQIGEL